MELKDKIKQVLDELDPRQPMANDTFYIPKVLRNSFREKCDEVKISKNKVITSFIKIFLEE